MKKYNKNIYWIILISDLDGKTVDSFIRPPHGVLILLYEVIYNAKKVK